MRFVVECRIDRGKRLIVKNDQRVAAALRLNLGEHVRMHIDGMHARGTNDRGQPSDELS